MIMYKADFSRNEITEVEINNITLHFVTLKNGSRKAKESNTNFDKYKYCYSMAAAQQYFIECYEAKINDLQAHIFVMQENLEYARQDLQAYKHSIK